MIFIGQLFSISIFQKNYSIVNLLNNHVCHPCPYNGIEVNNVADLLSLAAVFIMLFFLGMSILRVGLYQLSYQKMEILLTKFTKNIYLGVFTGTVTTAVLQSSSLIMVLTIGFVSIGFLTFKQSLGIILGANIGTTMTGELMTLSFIPEITFVVIGAFMLFINNRVVFGAGAILFGLGTIFVSLEGFESLSLYINQMPILSQTIIYTSTQPEFGALLGTVISAIIQSSSATIGITMSFLNEGILHLAPSIAIVLGANIGTCFTSLLAMVGSKKEAKLVGMAHIWFNIIGVLLFLPFLGWLSQIAELLSSDPKQQLAHISVLFNIATVLLFLPFINLFESFIRRLHSTDRRES
nr:Na/Pi symporter [Aquibacillus saliphilus]